MITRKQLVKLLKNVPDDTIVIVNTHAQTFDTHTIEVERAFYMSTEDAEQLHNSRYFVIELPYYTKEK
jgi:hypothetical protein